ncbi:hypothetical protein SPI_02515 [Niveomyces insectorum RCEF 264]|uniref:Vacuolar ATPase assembly protein VMA22 n=1 Tax=Niveomyces insectorum RCEF 264 TaxID=1081102 RepID=A0A162KBR6_9HYPO|nr:hypothetical protein SPI_02515 [Niveomyces insectorum RCEF 264]
MALDTVDDLLAKYLVLLHEYTRLRTLLASSQTRLYGHLARANFAAERGFRYGSDHYDGRMQATARLRIAAGSDGSGSAPSSEALSFLVTRQGEDKDGRVTQQNEEEEEEEEEETKTEQKETVGQRKGLETNEVNGARAKKAEKTTKRTGPPRDPLRWFGVLTPMALRQAQQEAVQVVDNIVPQLASLSAEMAAVEIAVRRARKKRARAAGGRTSGSESKENSCPLPSQQTASSS